MKKMLSVAISSSFLVAMSIMPIALADDFANPIVGTWSAEGGTVEVTDLSGIYEGVVTAGFTFADCVHEKGEMVMKILGSGTGDVAINGRTYLGSFQNYLNPPDCISSLATAELKVTKTGDSVTLTACPSWEGPCLTMTRTAAELDSKPPTISFSLDSTLTPLSLPIYQVFKATDDTSDQISVVVRLYSDGKQIGVDDATTFSVYSGDDQMVTFVHPKNEKGPFYICAVASDKAGNATGKFDNCVWRSIEAPMGILTNGCGAQGLTDYGTYFQNWLLDDIKYTKDKTVVPGFKLKKDYKVHVAPACDNHDAGYQGSTFKDAISGQLIDSRKMSRQDVDIKFKQDIATICSKAGLPTQLLVICIGGPKFLIGNIPSYITGKNSVGANTFATAVSQVAGSGYDSDSTVPREQPKIPATTHPSGGARNNKSNSSLVSKALVKLPIKQK